MLGLRKHRKCSASWASGVCCFKDKTRLLTYVPFLAVAQRPITYRSFATTVSQLKICDCSGEAFKGFEVLLFSMSAITAQLLSSGEFCKMHYDTAPVKSAYTNVSFYTNNSKMSNCEL